MDIRTILIKVDLDTLANGAVECAANLARRFDAKLIGVCAAQASPPIVDFDGGVAAAGL